MENKKRLIEIPEDGIIRIPIMAGETAVGEKCIDLSHIPTVDAVEVVRCKKCTKSRPLNRKNSFETLFAEECIWCKEHGFAMYEDDFCSYGERKVDT